MAYQRLALSKMATNPALMGQHALKHVAALGMGGGASQSIYDGGFQGINTATATTSALASHLNASSSLHASHATAPPSTRASSATAPPSLRASRATTPPFAHASSATAPPSARASRATKAEKSTAAAGRDRGWGV